MAHEERDTGKAWQYDYWKARDAARSARKKARDEKCRKERSRYENNLVLKLNVAHSQGE